METKSKHTPGPVTVEVGEDGFYQIWKDQGGSGYTVADGIGNKADATLYAAAPELLSLLKKAYDSLYVAGFTDLYREIEAAIAKAEGK